jgi:hypothetical protein
MFIGCPFCLGARQCVFGDDFRQVLPIIEVGARNEIVHALLIMSPLWSHIKVLQLKRNIRPMCADLWGEEGHGCHDFAQWVLGVREGTLPAHARECENLAFWISIPNDLMLHPSSGNIEAATESTYDSFFLCYFDLIILHRGLFCVPRNWGEMGGVSAVEC